MFPFAFRKVDFFLGAGIRSTLRASLNILAWGRSEGCIAGN